MKFNPIILSFLLTSLLIGCTGADLEPEPAVPSAVEIEPQASVATSRANLSGVQEGPQFPVSTDRVFAVSAFINDDAGNLTIPYFLNQPICSDAEGAYHFYHENGQRYYPEDGTPLYFYAVSPACAEQDLTDPKKLTWTLTGQEDIMYAKDLSGIAKDPADTHTQPHPNFLFKHLLTRFDFRVKYSGGYGDRLKIYGLRLPDMKDKAILNLDTSELTFDPDSKSDFTVEKEMLNVTSTTSTYYTSVLCSETDLINVVVNSMGIVYPQFSVRASDMQGATKFEAGKCYTIVLNFSGVDVKVTVSLAKWDTGGEYSDPITIH